MPHTTRTLVTLTVAAGLACVISGCTIKASTKTLTDTAMNFLSSTSGKSWFTEEGLVASGEEVNAFVAINFESVKQDMAKGQGEYLLSLGTLLGVAEGQHQEFGALTRERYPLLVPSDQTTPGEMMAALSREMSAHPLGNEPLPTE